jgi:ABC-type lipoprotein export system ATPase subunit
VTYRWTSIAELASDEKEKITDTATVSESEHSETKSGVFSLDDVSLVIPRGRLVAVVGRVGSGKSSLLQGVSSQHRPR